MNHPKESPSKTLPSPILKLATHRLQFRNLNFGKAGNVSKAALNITDGADGTKWARLKFSPRIPSIHPTV